jgi:hypothetical protein
MKHTAADTGSDTISVVLGNDHDIVRSGVKALLATMPGVEVIGEAGNGEELLGYPSADEQLTDRQIEILMLPARGLSRPEARLWRPQATAPRPPPRQELCPISRRFAR